MNQLGFFSTAHSGSLYERTLETQALETLNFRGVMGQAPKEEISDSKPNILLILTDDQGYHDVSYYGTEDIQTPNIDQLVGLGMRFDNFYANSSVCLNLLHFGG